MGKRVIEQPHGYQPIHIWENVAGEAWACCAYDHGPMCRLCQRVSETLAALLENCADGMLIARATPSGEFEFKITEAGHARAKALIGDDAEKAMRERMATLTDAELERVIHGWSWTAAYWVPGDEEKQIAAKLGIHWEGERPEDD